MRRHHPLILCSFLVLTACSAPDASAAGDTARSAADSDRGERPVAADVLGTIEATIDGEPMEFYIVAGDIRGQPYASAAWFEPDEERILFAVGGLDSADPPLDTFEQGAQGQPVSFGDYEGPVFSLMIELAPEPAPYSLALPNDDSQSALAYMPRPSFDDMDVMYIVASGDLEVTEVRLAGGRMSAEGTFSGTVRSLGTGEELQVVDGRFSVEDAPHLDEVTPPSM